MLATGYYGNSPCSTTSCCNYTNSLGFHWLFHKENPVCLMLSTWFLSPFVPLTHSSSHQQTFSNTTVNKYYLVIKLLLPTLILEKSAILFHWTLHWSCLKSHSWGTSTRECPNNPEIGLIEIPKKEGGNTRVIGTKHILGELTECNPLEEQWEKRNVPPGCTHFKGIRA